MAAPKASGRMIRRTISESERFAALRAEAAVLFVMLIPHFNSYGKMSGGPGTIKDEIVPLIPYFSYENLPDFLQEISAKTNVKWFRKGGRWWLHSLHFLSEHQDLRTDKMGSDDLPSYDINELDTGLELVLDNSKFSPGVVPDFPSREKLEVRRLKVEEEDLKQSFVGGGVETPTRTALIDLPAPAAQSQVEWLESMRLIHLQTCGLASVPPLAIMRDILAKNYSVMAIEDVYQAHGGDLLRYRQRNIVESLTAIRDGVARDPPKARALLRKSKSEEASEKGREAAKQFVERFNRREAMKHDTSGCRTVFGGDGDAR